MARRLAELPKGTRLTDHISLGVLTKTFPLKKVNAVLAATGRLSERQRDLPAHVVVYYVLALTLYMQVSYREVLRCLLEGIKWLPGPEAIIKIAGKSGISQARRRLGPEPLRLLCDQVVGPIAGKDTQGAWYRRWRLVSVDGSTLDIADTAENEKAFGRPSASRGTSAYPQLRLVSLVENGTHVLFGTQSARMREARGVPVVGRLNHGLKQGPKRVQTRNDARTGSKLGPSRNHLTLLFSLSGVCKRLILVARGGRCPRSASD
jgi:hypothetical protein